MDPVSREQHPPDWRDRIRKGWLKPAASVGAFAAIVAAALRVRPEPPVRASGRPAAPPDPAANPGAFAPDPSTLERNYTLDLSIGGAASPHHFRRSLKDVTVGQGDEICALGDEEVRVFDPAGALVRTWKAAAGASCLTVAKDGKYYLGVPGRVLIFDPHGRPAGGFDAGDPGKPADVTAIGVSGDHILVADAFSRVIRRYDSGGRQTGEIGTRGKAVKFMLPNRWLEFDVDRAGTIYAADSGRHRVSSWRLDGEPVGRFGKFGHHRVEDFVGCCNPVNLAVAPDGSIVTGEKMVARVKVYSPDGSLLALIGPENFDPGCTHIHLAVDSRGRIVAADPVRREIKVFSPGA